MINKISLSKLFVFIFVFVFVFCSFAWPGEFIVFGPKDFKRESGAPIIVLDNFSVLNHNTEYFLRVYNGGLEDSEAELVSSSTVSLNGVEIVGPQNFNQGVRFVEKPLNLQLSNSLETEVRGKPGGLISVKVVGVDNIIPDIQIIDPPNGSSVKISPYRIKLSFSDSISGVNPNSLRVFINDLNKTGYFEINSNSVSGEASADIALSEGTNIIKASIADLAGNIGLAQAAVFLDTAPTVLPISGFIHGQVFDSKTGFPLSSASVVTKGIQGTVYTDEKGKFTFPSSGTGEFFLTIKKSGYTYVQRKVTVVSLRDAVVDPVYLTPLDTQFTTIGLEGGSVGNSSGTIVVEFPPGAVNEPIQVNITQYARGRDLPGQLPENSHFTYAADFLPDGFIASKPMKVRVKNTLGFKPATPIPLGYYNKNTFQWEPVGMGKASLDGLWLEFEITHFSPYDFNCAVLPPPKAKPPMGKFGYAPKLISKANDVKKLAATDPGIEIRSGNLGISFDLPVFKSLGKPYNLALNYNSSSVNTGTLIGAETIIYGSQIFPIPNWFPEVYTAVPETATFKLEIEGINKEIKFSGYNGEASQRFYWDGRNAREDRLSTGSYPYKITLSNNYRANFATAEYFGGTPLLDTGVQAPESKPLESVVSGRVIINNQADSPFGAGWSLNILQSLHFDPDGRIVLTEGDASAIIFNPVSTGIITTIAGTGQDGYGGDGGPAAQAQLKYIRDIFCDTAGNIYIADGYVRKIDTNGIITTIPQTEGARCVWVDKEGNIFFSRNYRVYKIDTNGIVTIIAGKGTIQDYLFPSIRSGDGGLAVDAEIFPTDICMDGYGNLYISDAVYGGFNFRKVDTQGIITKVCYGYEGIINGGKFTIDDKGDLFVADTWNQRVRKIDTFGTITTVAGMGANELGSGYSGDAGPAVTAQLSLPNGIAVDSAGNLYVSDQGNNCIRKIDTQGMISTIAGTGHSGFGGDADLASFAEFNIPQGICLSPKGDLLVFDSSNRRIRKIDFSQTNAVVYKPQEGDYSYLIKNNQDSSFRRIMKDGILHNFNSAGLLLSSVDRNSNTVTYNYDSEAKLISLTDSVNQITCFDYDSSGRLAGITDPAGRSTHFLIDSYGNLIQITNPDGSLKKFVYNTQHLLTEEINEKGYSTLYVYDELGKVKEAKFPQGEVIKFGPSETKGLINVLPAGVGTPENPAPVVRPEDVPDTIIDGNNNSSINFTDRFGGIIKQTDALGRTTGITRDYNSNPREIILANQGIIRMNYDPSGALNEFSEYSYYANQSLNTKFEYEPKFNQITKISAPNGVVEISYDNKGNAVYVANSGYGSTINNTNLTYDLRGLVKTLTNALGKTTQFNYDNKGNLVSITDPLNNTEYLTYDLAGNVTSYKDALGRITQFEYDIMNRLISLSDPQSKVRRYEYDLGGNLIKITDSSLNETAFEYDSLNQLVKVVDPLGRAKTFNYDFNGNLISAFDAKGQTINYQYDAANQLIKKILPDGIAGFAYDSVGRLIETSDNDSNLKFAYDNIYLKSLASRVIQADTGDAQNPGMHQPVTQIKYSYYAKPYAIAMTLPDNRVISYNYDAYSRLNQIKMDAQGLTFAYNYDNLSRRTFTPSAKYHFYDDNSRLVSLKEAYSGPVRFQYAYDSIGNRVSMTDSFGLHSYAYDLLDRLISTSNPEESFTYDTIGNRLSSVSNPVYAYDKANQLLDDGTYIYTYDANGNLSAKTDKQSPLNKTSYTYNSENQLIRIDFPDGKYANYRYDALGRRTEKDVNGVIRRYVYDNEDIIAEYDGLNNLIATYIHGSGIDEPLMMERNNQKYYYKTDAQGSVVQLTDSNGAVVQSYTYDAFGNIINQTGSLENPYTFTGRELDPESGLYYYRNRYYDSKIGRFLQEDPIWDVNLYAYVGNSPLNFIDPWGLRMEKAWWDKLGEGYYYGTGFGIEAAEWYARQQLETGNYLWAIPGGLSSLWTPETYQATGWTIITAYSLNQAFVKSAPEWAHYEHARGPHKYPHVQLIEKRIEVPKIVIDIVRKKIVNFIKEYF